MPATEGRSGGGRLDIVLVERGLARSRSHAAELIKAGRVAVDGRAVVKPAAPVADEAGIEVEVGDAWVSRAAHKLIAALDAFGLEVAGRTALDVGASTGGFTQVLLSRGAAHVVALDVGHGQLSAALAPEIVAGRLVSLEGRNARELTAAALAPHHAAPFSLVVADLSFIGLPLVLPAIVGAAPEAELVVLIKPQFEVGRTGVREGIVHDPSLRADAIDGVLWAAHDLGLATAGLIASPIVGSHGNAEYLARLSRHHGADPSQWRDTIAGLTGA